MGGDSASRPARTLAERTADELGPPTILVNNAGQASRGRSVEHTSHEEYMHLYQVHVLAAAEACAAVLPGMRRAGGKSIAFISSVVARGLGPGSAPYAMAKAAGEALASVLSFEERPHGIRVNTVAPRLVSTEMGDRLVRASLASAASSAGELSSSTFARLLMIPVQARSPGFIVITQHSTEPGETSSARLAGEPGPVHCTLSGSPTAHPAVLRRCWRPFGPSLPLSWPWR